MLVLSGPFWTPHKKRHGVEKYVLAWVNKWHPAKTTTLQRWWGVSVFSKFLGLAVLGFLLAIFPHPSWPRGCLSPQNSLKKNKPAPTDFTPGQHMGQRACAIGFGKLNFTSGFYHTDSCKNFQQPIRIRRTRLVPRCLIYLESPRQGPEPVSNQFNS